MLLAPRPRFNEEKFMTDNLQNRGPADRTRVNVHEEWEVRYWRDKFDCTHDELIAAVKAVGTSANEVQNYLASSRSK